MLTYLLRRLLLMIPTLFGIMLVSFAIVQFVPGGPVERTASPVIAGVRSASLVFS